MADTLEPYPVMPGSDVPSPEAMNVSRHNAEWATTFQAGTTNLAQRARHAQDIRQYTADLATQRAAKQADLLATNKDAQNFYLHERALTLQEQKANFDMADKRTKADAALALQPSIMAAKQAQTAANIATTKAHADEAAANAAIQTQAANVRTIVSNAKPFVTPEQLDEVYHAAATQNPGAVHDKDIGPQIVEARKNLSLRQKQAEIDAKATASGMTPNLVTESGLQTYHSGKPDKPTVDPELAQLKADLSLGLSNQKKASLGDQPKYAPGLEELRKKIAAKEGGTTAPTTVRKRFNPETGKIETVQ